MTDNISKLVKIVLLFNSVAAFIFGFLYLVIPGIYANLEDALYFDPYYWRAFGATLIILGVFALIVVTRADMRQIELLIEIAIAWVSVIILLDFWQLIVFPLSPTYRIHTWINTILLIVLDCVNIFTYIQIKK
ncbi:MAG: hypothetical protein GF383_15185 [Candidatus Lokiarchaeota archaeon]|nr:hypothetical protein [Candidatus Lokiarchaeota archaeon]MBD3342863.1 hypothetical protein [Candidatus Lokiarchaeota archaeon]